MLQPLSRTRCALHFFVQANTTTISRPAEKLKRPRHAPKQLTAADAEINAYAAIRDLLLNDAEKTTSEETVRRVIAANDAVEACLLPLRSPYEAQFLSEIDATRERQRCLQARRRIGALQRKLA